MKICFGLEAGVDAAESVGIFNKNKRDDFGI